ncbi:MAG: VOC family protein [Gammaproteobacteria bacterium]
MNKRNNCRNQNHNGNVDSVANVGNVNISNATPQSIAGLSAEQVGWLLEGFGVNLLVRRIADNTAFLREVLGFHVLRADDFYALLEHRGHLHQLHVDATYHAHPLAALLPTCDLRGAGVELRLYGLDPDVAETRARNGGYEVLQSTADKPHGLRECFLLDPDGYCWVPSMKKTA